MTRHLLRLIWNRKRQNFLLTVEIFFSFLTLFGVVLFAVHYANNARQPLGFEHRPGLERHRRPQGAGRGSGGQGAPSRDLPAAGRRRCARCRRSRVWPRSFTGPYANSNWGGGMRLVGGRQVDYGVNRVTDDFPTLFHIPLVAGRWFSREDDAATWTPVVLNRRMAREIFGDADPIGQIIKEERDPNEPPPDPDDKPEVKRVIGVIDEFRQNGELSTAENYMFQRMRLDDAEPEGGACPSASTCGSARDAGGVRGDAGEARDGGRRRLVVRGAAARRACARTSCGSTPCRSAIVGTIAALPAADGRRSG